MLSLQTVRVKIHDIQEIYETIEQPLSIGYDTLRRRIKNWTYTHLPYNVGTVIDSYFKILPFYIVCKAIPLNVRRFIVFGYILRGAYDHIFHGSREVALQIRHF